MGLDFFRRSVETAVGYLKRGQRAVHTIQTNGTVIDAEWAEFFKANEDPIPAGPVTEGASSRDAPA